MAPRTHNLIYLAQLADLELLPAYEEILSTLSLEYTELRYPTDLTSVVELNDEASATEQLQRTEELFQWLEAQRK